MREWLVEGGRGCSLFLHRLVLVARCLLACLVSLSCLVSRVCERASNLHLFGLSSLEVGSSLFRFEREIEVGEMYFALDRDARIKLSIGTTDYGGADGEFYNPLGLVFDHHQGLLLVADSRNHRVQVFSCDDGFSFVSKFGEKGDQSGQLNKPWSLAIDHDHDRILVVDCLNSRVQSWSLSEQSFLSCIGHHGSGDDDTYNDRLVFLSSIDLSFLFSIGKQGSRPGEFLFPSGVAIDHDRHRIIVIDTGNHRVQVLSLIDGSFLFEFGSKGDQPGQLKYPEGVCKIGRAHV